METIVASGRLLKADEAAAYLQISSRSLWQLTKDGLVKSVRPTPGTVRYTVAALDTYISSLAK